MGRYLHKMGDELICTPLGQTENTGDIPLQATVEQARDVLGLW